MAISSINGVATNRDRTDCRRTRWGGNQDLDFGPEISLTHLMSSAEKKARYTSLEFRGAARVEIKSGRREHGEPRH